MAQSFNKPANTIQHIDCTAYGSLRPVRNCALGRDDVSGVAQQRRNVTQGPSLHAKVTLTFPSPDNSIFTLSPALSHTVLTRLPVSTICPACSPLPSSAR